VKRTVSSLPLSNAVESLTDSQIARLSSLISSRKVTSQTSATSLERQLDIHGTALDAIQSVIQKWQGIEPALLGALQTTLQVRRSIARDIDIVDLVWTAPVQFSTPTRSPSSVMREMILGATQRVTVVGYRMTRGAFPIFQALGVAFGHGIKVRLLFDQVGEQMETFLRLWPIKGRYPEIFNKTSEGTLHAKVVLVDGIDMLVTSANLTAYALRQNLEVGVRIRGPTVLRLDSLFNRLVRTRHFTQIEPGVRQRPK